MNKMQITSSSLGMNFKRYFKNLRMLFNPSLLHQSNVCGKMSCSEIHFKVDAASCFEDIRYVLIDLLALYKLQYTKNEMDLR